MTENDNKNLFHSHFKSYIWVVAAVWTIIVAVSLVWNLWWSIPKEHILIMSAVHVFMWVLVLCGIFVGGRKLIRTDQMRIRAAKEMKDLNTELSVLFTISAAISRTIDLNDLLSSILTTIVKIDIFKVEPKGGIFILEGNRMKLVSHLGHTDSFLNTHKKMSIGECLCGKAAETGAIIISKNCMDDPRHTIVYPGMTPHGHIIIPLKSKNKVVGVLYLYLETNFDMDEAKLGMFTSIGDQIGLAVVNARLYERTKRSSLHDPLTGLANRRFMAIILKRNFANSVRFKRPLSVIMLDIDHFKAYNDTHGHNKGDNALVDVAKVLLKESREIDLAVRYGGEEFLVLLPETDLEGARDVAERIRQTIEATTNVTVSLGVTSYHEKMHQEEIVIKADKALYMAKNNGRNRVEVSK
ncbi:putative diguanylate cyclase YdaM [bacterium BMS3Abin09]|nr:putative diguanylate cyclase YdaM [bacterium BMS3Abin09]HDH33929.1 GGDEF domain-containing protein [Nitrospirota bacterium]